MGKMKKSQEKFKKVVTIMITSKKHERKFLRHIETIRDGSAEKERLET